ncbi:transketolase C-terminal domain-containing protein [Klenkia terrae]|uniref:transketolase C-terminal domain-containing protein n=1 Tax=Klenkia terrae TaxID=1052259 RepID=UPI003614C484
MGHLDLRRGPRAPDGDAARRGDPQGGPARGGGGHRRADRAALPEGLRAGLAAGGRAGRAGRRAAPGAAPEVLLVACGSLVPAGLAAAERAAQQGIEVTVVDPRWVLPASPELVQMCAGHKLVVTLEDGGRSGGVGRPWPRRCATPSSTSRCAASGCRRSSWSTAPAPRCWPTTG